jgi:predicted ATPase/class 3 adenylate cyclase
MDRAMTAVSQPSGTVTLVFTDIEGSTRLLDELGMDAYRDALAEHRAIVREACSHYSGYEVDYEGDAFFYAFSSAQDAVSAVSEAMAGLDDGPISIRVGIHTGEPGLDPPKYVGMDVHFAARVMSSAHGGQVVLTQTTADLVETPLTSLGAHRLKDISEPVSLYQLGNGAFPSLKTIANSNLPTPTSSFLGREDELREADHLLQHTRLLTIHGPGGQGKTRFALELATRARNNRFSDYADGIFACFLSSLRDPALVLPTIAQTLAVREQPGQSALEALSSHLQTKKHLLVLDNAEHLLECASELSQLLQACPQLTLLVTSRELLRIQGEEPYALPSLPQDEGIALFCERAHLEPSETIAQIAERLEGLPLAIELAAARTRILSPEQLLERLSQRLDLLKGSRDADPRQQTLRATIEWSYDLLSPDEQRLFASLSVFQGGCTLEAAEEVADADLDSLQSLVDKSLLRFSDERFWMLETIREFAAEQMSTEDQATTSRVHAHYFLELAESSEPRLWAQETDVWLPRLDAEQPNFRAALGWSIHEDAEAAVRLSGALYPYWEIRARQKEARMWLELALALGGAIPPGLRAKALTAAGRVAGWACDWSAASVLLAEAVDLCRRLGDTAGVGRCLGFMGHVRLFQGDVSGAAAALNEAVELARRTDDRQSLARALSNAAWSAIEARDFDRARRMWEEGASISRVEGMKPSEALCVVHIGYAYALAGNFGRALDHLEDGLVLFEELGETTWTPVAQRYVGLVALLDDDIEVAEEHLRASLRRGRERAPQFHLVYWLDELAAVATAKGDAQRAATLWAATDAQYERLGMAVIEEGRQVRERYRVEVDGRSAPIADARARGRSMTLEDAVSFALVKEPV